MQMPGSALPEQDNQGLRLLYPFRQRGVRCVDRMLYCQRTVNLSDWIDAAGNELRKTVERWDNRLKLEGLSGPEAYLEGRLSLLLNLKRYRSGEFCDIEY